MENLERRKQPVVLNSENAFEFDIARGLKELIDDMDSFYHIEVRDDLLTIEKQGYNTPSLASVQYDMSQLVKNEVLDQKKDAIREAYMYTFSKTGDLKSRVDALESKMFADSHDGASHAFYHDRTGKYPESEIVAPFREEFVKDEKIGMHR